MRVVGFGEFVQYMHYFTDIDIDYLRPWVTYGMVFDKTDFYLARVEQKVVSWTVKGAWTDAGSEAEIKNFFIDNTSRRIRVLSELCDHFRLTPRQPLGYGAFARVVKVMIEFRCMLMRHAYSHLMIQLFSPLLLAPMK